MLRVSKKNRIVLGIDPGLADTGFGVIKGGKNNLKVLASGSIKTKAKAPIPQRLKKIHQEINKLIKKYQPEVIAVEQIFFCKNLKTAIVVSQARGVVLLAAGQKQIPVQEFTPLQIKQALTSYGKASKNQVQQMVKFILKLEKIPRPDDAADALACALCCAQTKIF